MSIVINGSGSISGLAVGGLPDGTVDAGTLATNSVDSAELIDGAVDDSHMAAMAASKLSGTVATARMPTGSVLQVVQGSTGTAVESTSVSYADTGLSASITPSSTSSKILVRVHQNGGLKEAAGSGVLVQLYRGSTVLTKLTHAAGYNNVNQVAYLGAISTEYLDSPSTASAVTYKTQFANNQAISSSHLQVGSTTSFITLMEIAG